MPHPLLVLVWPAYFLLHSSSDLLPEAMLRGAHSDLWHFVAVRVSNYLVLESPS